MDLILDNVWKRYTTGWILKEISEQLNHGQKVAITGNNGSGKSTLLQIVSGYLSPSKGKIIYKHDGNEINRDHIYKYLSISAAYSELDEELTIPEIYNHYKLFKPLVVNRLDEFLEITEFVKHKGKQIRYFSSGMKQRLSLGLAFVMDVPLLLLDEPTSFLDKHKKGWYTEMMHRFAADKLVIVASNDEHDIGLCERTISL